MGQSVQEFIKAAQAKEREEFEKKRDSHLVELGLVDDDKTIINYSEFPTSMWDSEKQKYYTISKGPLTVTDEEYKEILRLTKSGTETPVLHNYAERFLNIVLIISLIVEILCSIGIFAEGVDEYEESYLIIGIALFILSFVNFAVGKVILNISNNLHSINSKIKNS